MNYIDHLGLEEVQISVFTIIRPPDSFPGIKSTHLVVVNEYGTIVRRDDTVGVTDFGEQWQGSGTFYEHIEGFHPSFIIRMGASVASALLSSLLDISYNFDINLNFCTRKGHFSGNNDGYPSYQVRVGRAGLVYDWQQLDLWDLGLGPEIWPSRDFYF